MPKINLENKTVVVVGGERHHLEQGEQEVSEEVAKELGIESPKAKASTKKEAE